MHVYGTVLLLAPFSFGIPLGQSNGNTTVPHNKTSNSSDPSWVTTPNVRGTYDLVLSCLLTLVLCAWTAYHPNIPEKKSSWALIGRRLKWVLVAVIAPEVVLAIAFTQLRIAWQFMGEINAIAKIKSRENEIAITKLFPVSCRTACIESAAAPHKPPFKPPAKLKSRQTWSGATLSDIATAPNTHRWQKFEHEDGIGNKPAPWKLSQAFFALSGGLAVRSDSFYPLKRIVFEPKGILTLARLGILPPLQKDDVEDRSKADTFTKVLVCLQAGWFFAQSLARLQQGLPLTLLEIHTNTHVFCAFLMYAIWAAKPYDVGAPMICTDERVVNIAAFFAAEAHDREASDGRRQSTSHCTVSDYLTLDHIESAHQSPIFDDSTFSHTMQTVARGLPFLNSSFPPKYLEVDQNLAKEHLKRANKAIAFMRGMGCHFGWTERIPNIEAEEHREGLTRSIEFEMTTLISTKAKTVPIGLSSTNLVAEQLLAASKPDPSELSPGEKAVDKASISSGGNFTNALVGSESFIGKHKLGKWIFTVFSAMYGGAHLSAWNSHFPSNVEMWMWRIGGICLAAGPFFAGIVLAMSDLDNWISKKSLDARNRHAGTGKFVWWRLWKWLYRFVLYPLVVGCSCVVTVYIPARFYVVAEAFASLRSPPVGTYRTENWLSYIPHAN